uniref:Uncharacterized protein n=1 Tax=Arundo donax TaxID=35708 RepID=A0A0A9FDN3_ARUDO
MGGVCKERPEGLKYH